MDPRERQRQFLIRRAVFAVGIVLVFILVLLAVRGCLDARKERAFENYGSELRALSQESQQIADQFFQRLSGPSGTEDLSLQQAINADRSAAEQLLQRVQNLDTPDEVGEPQEDVVRAFELRRDALADIAQLLAEQPGDRQQNRLARLVARDMEAFLASDVLFNLARDQILAVFEEEGIAADIPRSEFLSDDEDWLDQATVAAALGAAGGVATPDDGLTHGLGLGSVTVGGITLVEGSVNTVPVTDAELAVAVQNQGEAPEEEITVRYTIDGGPSGRQTISTIAAGETQTVAIPINPAPPTGQTLSLEVSVDPVPGEQVEDNNTATYEVIFE